MTADTENKLRDLNQRQPFTNENGHLEDIFGEELDASDYASTIEGEAKYDS